MASINSSGDLFIHGFADQVSSGNLVVVGHVDAIASGDMFIHGLDNIQASGDLFIHGDEDISSTPPAPSLFIIGGTEARPFDWFIQTSDYFPQLIGSFPAANNVNIQVWDVTNAQNILVSISNSGCYPIGNTGRWGWSTSGLPSSQSFSEQYFYVMTSNIGETFDGQFMMNVPEDAKWIYPSNQSDYLKQI